LHLARFHLLPGQRYVGTMNVDGRIARDTIPGLMKTCTKLGVSFFTYAGDRLRVVPQRSPSYHLLF
jgi:hypothetical protein